MQGYPIEPMHAAHLALLEGALRSLLRSAGEGEEPNDQPDAITVRLDSHGVELEYLRGKVAVGGESL